MLGRYVGKVADISTRRDASPRAEEMRRPLAPVPPHARQRGTSCGPRSGIWPETRHAPSAEVLPALCHTDY